MSDLWGLLSRIGALFTWWVIVTPWEEAIRVRFGKHTRRLSAGVHLKLPIVDAIYKQSVRLRATSLPMQTITTRDGKTLTLSATFNYSISDLEKLYRTLHHAEDTLRNISLGAIAAYVQGHSAEECGPDAITSATCAALNLGRYGLQCEGLQLIDFAFVRTHRLIMDSKWGSHGDALNTNDPTKVPS